MKTLKKIFIWIAIMVVLIIGSDYAIHYMMKTSEYKKDENISTMDIEDIDMDKDSLLMGFLAFLLIY